MHPTPAELLAHAAGELPGPERERVASHLGSCPACRRFSDLVDGDAHAADPAQAAAPPAGTDADADLVELPTVDRRLYAQVTELADGVGGMGRTYRARDRRLGREVALKQPLGAAELGDPLVAETLRKRFEREARLTARLEHPAIVAVYEAGRFAGGEPFYAMRLQPGRPLADELAARPTLLDRLALLPNLITVAEALAYAHERGVIHRDVKPDNVIVGRFGETVLIDWGLAWAEDEHRAEAAADAGGYRQSELPLTQIGVGTPGYMPRAQLSGETPTPAFDVHALGATLYHLLAGAPAYGKGDADTLRKRTLAGPPRPLREVAPDVPAPLAALVARAMGDSPPTAAAVAEELRRFQAGQLLTSHQYSPAERLRLFLRRHRAAALVAVVAALVLAVASVIAVRRVVRERDTALASRRASLLARWRAEGIAVSQLAGTRLRRVEALALAARAIADAEAAGAEPPPELLQGAVDALGAWPPARALEGNRGLMGGATVTPDGEFLLGVDLAGNAMFWRLPDGALARTVKIPEGNYRNAVLRPGDPLVAFWGVSEQIVIIDTSNDRVVGVTRPGVPGGAALAPDGTLIVADKELAVIERATGRVLEALPLPVPAGSVAVGTDGTIGVGLGDGRVATWRRGEPPPVFVAAHDGGKVGSMCARGEQFWSGGYDGTVQAWTRRSLAAGTTTPRLSVAGGAVRAIHPLGDDAAVALVSGNRSAVQQYAAWMLGADGTASALAGQYVQPLHRVAPGHVVVFDETLVSAIDPTAGGARWRFDRGASAYHAYYEGDEHLVVAQVSGAVGTWDVSGGGVALLEHTSEIAALAVAPDGESVVSVGLDGRWRAWGQQQASGRGARGLWAASWSPDGRRVLLVGDDGVVSVGMDGAAAQVAGEEATAAAWDEGDVLVGKSDGTLVVGGKAMGSPGEAIASVTALPDGGAVSAHVNGEVRVFGPGGDLRAARRLDPERFDAVRGVWARGDELVLALPGGPTFFVEAATLAPRRSTPGEVMDLAVDGTAVIVDGNRLLLERPGAAAPDLLSTGATTFIAAALSADARLLATGDSDGEVVLWDLATRAPRWRLAAREPRLPTALAFWRGGHELLVGHDDGALRRYPTDVATARRLLCGALVRFATDAPCAGLVAAPVR